MSQEVLSKRLSDLIEKDALGGKTLLFENQVRDSWGEWRNIGADYSNPVELRGFLERSDALYVSSVRQDGEVVDIVRSIRASGVPQEKTICLFGNATDARSFASDLMTDHCLRGLVTKDGCFESRIERSFHLDAPEEFA